MYIHSKIGLDFFIYYLYRHSRASNSLLYVSFYLLCVHETPFSDLLRTLIWSQIPTAIAVFLTPAESSDSMSVFAFKPYFVELVFGQ